MTIVKSVFSQPFLNHYLLVPNRLQDNSVLTNLFSLSYKITHYVKKSPLKTKTEKAVLHMRSLLKFESDRSFY